MKKSATNVLKHIVIDSLRLIIKEIDNLSDSDIKIIIDKETEDSDTKSIQTILTHTIFSGHGYINYISEKIGIYQTPVKKNLLNSTYDYKLALERLIDCFESMAFNLNDDMIEETNIDKKIVTSWKQTYDIEQLMEHAIVHNYRHLYQIKNYHQKIKTLKVD